MKKPDYISLFTSWESRTYSSVWCAYQYTEEKKCPSFEPFYFGAPQITTDSIHPVKGRDSAPCVTVGKGLWKDKIYHFLPNMPASSDGEEMHSELFVPYKDFRAAMEALYEIRDTFMHLV